MKLIFWAALFLLVASISAAEKATTEKPQDDVEKAQEVAVKGE